MKSRVIAAVAAVVLAAVGAVLILRYVAGADARAMAGMQTTTVLVVTSNIPAGTPAAQLAKVVAPKELPRTAVAPGALTNLGVVAGKVTNADLVAGEQLLSARFSAAGNGDVNAVKVPDNLQQVSILLDAQRVPMAHLSPGDLVGVYITVKQPEPQTHLTVSQVLVTQVQGGVAPASSDTTANASSADKSSASGTDAPKNTILVTLALTAPQAERVVFAAENGTVWLSLETKHSDDRNTTVVTGKNVYR